jgi:ABC-type multidrug transport system fused ATPase/permease subunit
VSVLPPVLDRRRRPAFVRLVLNGLFQAGAIIGAMILVRHAFNVMLNPAFDDPEVHLFDMREVWQVALFALGLLACTGAAALLRMAERIDAERLGQSYVHRIRLLLFDSMAKFAPRALASQSTGAVALRFVGDLNALRRWVSMGLARIVVAAIVVPSTLGFMAWLDPWLALGCALVLGLGLVGNLLLGPRMHRTVAEARRRRGHLAANITEKIASFAVLQAFDQVRRERARFSRHSRRLRDAMVERAQSSGQMRVITEGATAVSMALVLSQGALEVFWGMTSSGNVVAALAVVGFLVGPLRGLGRVHEYYQAARVSREKVEDFLQTRRMRGRSPRREALTPADGTIRVEGVSVAGALSDVSAIVEGGQRVALLGANGSGKSTLLYVIARLVDPDAGRVLIDGQELGECNIASVRRAISLVSPDLPLLRGSLESNLRYRWPDAPDEEVARVRRICGLDELLDKLPRGARFRVQEGGQNLSLGQRHRLTMARALLGNPAILLLDEFDANLDEETRALLDVVLEEFPGTVVMITRDEARIARADCIWRLEEGRMVEDRERPVTTPTAGVEMGTVVLRGEDQTS